MAVDSFTGKLAVVTGGGSGIGRELVRQLAVQGCSVAACDLNPDSVAVTAATAWAAAPPGVRVTSHVCDVSDEAQVLRFRDELLEQHASDHVNLVFSNAGIFAGASFVKDSRQEWETHLRHQLGGRVFLRPHVPAAADRRRRRACSSTPAASPVSGPRQALARRRSPLTARRASPSRASPRHSSKTCAPMRRRSGSSWSCRVLVNTDIAENSRLALGLPEWEQLSDAELLELIPETGRAVLVATGLLAEDFSADDLRQAIPRLKDEFRDKGFTAAQAAASVLDGVRSGAWRILVGEEAKMLDEQVHTPRTLRPPSTTTTTRRCTAP